MTTATKERQAQRFEDLVPEDDFEDTGDGYDGTITEITLAHAIMRNHQIVTPAMSKAKPIQLRCVLVGRGEQAHWVGPDAQHLMDLLEVGVVAGSRQQRMRAKRQAAIDMERGVDPDPEDSENLNGKPGLAEQTPEQVAAQWRRTLSGGAREVLRRELQESADEATDKRRHIGAQAPGSARARLLHDDEPTGLGINTDEEGSEAKE